MSKPMPLIDNFAPLLYFVYLGLDLDPLFHGHLCACGKGQFIYYLN